jgi:uncharacterized protein involved in response to NO
MPASIGAPLRQHSAFLSYGFRPFFLLAALSAVVTLAVLVGSLVFGAWPSDALPPSRWHGHEMLFGFVAAAIAGFLLTAVPTWTNRSPLSGLPLAGLALLWLAGRAVWNPWFGLHATALVLLDALFFPAIAVAAGLSLVPARNYRNLPFLVILALLTAADIVFVAAHLGWIAPTPFDPLRFAANLVQLMIAVIGGRIVPLFTRNALAKAGLTVSIAPVAWLDRAALAAVGLVIAIDLVRPSGPAAGVAAGVAAALLAARLARWHGHRTLRMPIVWILHVGYAWVVAALALKAVWILGGALWAANWLHALTAGAFGTMILGVMTRVALGHTGRPLQVSAPIVLAYVLVTVGALLRVAAPALALVDYVYSLTAAMIAWAGAFVVFVAAYFRILLSPRAPA